MRFVERGLKEAGESGLASIVRAVRQEFERRGHGKDIALPVNLNPVRIIEIRLETQKVYPEISLSAEHRRQARILAKKFAKKLNMTEEEYIAALPPFPEKPANYDDLGLTVPLIAEGKRIPWIAQASISNIEIDDYLRSRANEMRDWQADPFSFTTPEEAFTTWIQDGTKFVNRKPRDVRSQLIEDLRAGGIEEIIAGVNLRPDIIKGKGWDLPRPSVGSGGVVCLLWFDEQPMLYAYFDDVANPSFRSLVCGRKIGT